MNAEQLRIGANLVIKNPRYDQSELAHPCNAPACIAGTVACASVSAATWSRYTKRDIYGDLINPRAIWSRAKRVLGLTEDEADLLFDYDGNEWGDGFDQKWIKARGDRKAERRVAAAYLRHLAKQADKEEKAKK